MIGVAVLFFGVSSAYDFVGLSGSKAPSAMVLWSVLGSGFALTSSGLIAAAVQLPRGRRKALAGYLLGIGGLLLLIAMPIAHVGPLLLILGVPAIIVGAIVGIMALPFPRLFKVRPGSSKPRV